MPKAVRLCTISAILLLPLFFFFGCSGGDKAAPAGANVNVRISDPATCSGPAGAFSHIYVTITDVRISASNGDSGWIDLTPSLAQNPQQIDLLGQANNQCFLATLGATTALQPGSYQQIRIMLADNSTAVANNVCGGTANCVMISSSPNTALPLLLSSEAHTGIKIPSGQIAGGQFSIAAGETKDLDIDFNACESIVAQGNGQFRLKPVLHAGEVSLTSTSINGTAVDSVTNQPITGGNTVVALEQKDGFRGRSCSNASRNRQFRRILLLPGRGRNLRCCDRGCQWNSGRLCGHCDHGSSTRQHTRIRACRSANRHEYESSFHHRAGYDQHRLSCHHRGYFHYSIATDHFFSDGDGSPCRAIRYLCSPDNSSERKLPH